MKNIRTRKVIGAAMLATVSFVLQFLELPMPLSPAFARFDFSDLPALIGAFAYWPLWGVVIELVKNLLHLTVSATGGIGELANFAMGAALVYPAGLIYKKHKSRKTALFGCVVGSLCMGVMAAVMNYFVLVLMTCWDKTVCWRHPQSGAESGPTDATIVSTHMMLEAASLGLGTVWISYFDQEKARELLGIPEHYGINNMLYIGYPAADFKPNPKMSGKRFPIDKTCFDNGFDTPYQTDFFEEAATVHFGP